MKVGAPLPLSHLVIGECTNAPFATDLSRVLNTFDSLAREAISAQFPPGPESFLPIPVFYIPLDAFYLTISLTTSFIWCGQLFWPLIYLHRVRIEPATEKEVRGSFTTELSCCPLFYKRPLCDRNSPVFDGDSRSQEDAVFAHFPPCPESFLQDLLISPYSYPT